MRRALVITTCLLLLAACGGDDGAGGEALDDATTAPTTAAEPQAEPSATVVVTSVPDTVVGDGPAEAPDPCTLVTKEEIAAALGGSVTDGVQQPGLIVGAKACQWDGDGDGVAALRFARLEVRVGDRATLDASFDQWADYNDTSPVADVGERAQWAELTNTLDVIQGTTYIVVQVAGAAGDQVETSTAIAKAALERLA